MNDKNKSSVNSKTIKYIYHFDDSMANLNEETRKSNNCLDDKGNCLGNMNHAIYKTYTNQKGDIVRETYESSDGNSNEDIYENIYDEHSNIVKKVIHQNSIFYSEVETSKRTFEYKNIYENDKLLQILELDNDNNSKVFATIDYEYENNLLIKKNIKDNYRGTSNILYSYRDGKLHEEAVVLNGELSCYYSYTILEDGRVKRILVNPSRGKYRWNILWHKNDPKSCEVNIYEPLYNVKVIEEIMEYVLENYRDKINCVIVDVLDTIYIDGESLENAYDYFLDNYDVRILENF